MLPANGAIFQRGQLAYFCVGSPGISQLAYCIDIFREQMMRSGKLTYQEPTRRPRAISSSGVRYRTSRGGADLINGSSVSESLERLMAISMGSYDGCCAA
jgi:hypothetical protein